METVADLKGEYIVISYTCREDVYFGLKGFTKVMR